MAKIAVRIGMRQAIAGWAIACLAFAIVFATSAYPYHRGGPAQVPGFDGWRELVIGVGVPATIMAAPFAAIPWVGVALLRIVLWRAIRSAPAMSRKVARADFLAGVVGLAIAFILPFAGGMLLLPSIDFSDWRLLSLMGSTGAVSFLSGWLIWLIAREGDARRIRR